MPANVIPRPTDAERLHLALAESPAVLLTGPRQAGKSTLARTVVQPDPDHHFDLEDPRDLARLADPMLTLEHLPGTVVIDEAQRLPALFPALRVLIDADRRPGRFLVLGSASPELVGLGSESLAGRVRLLELTGFRATDLGPDALDALWRRGGLPPSTLADDEDRSNRWRDDYITTFLQRDLADLGYRTPATTMRRFWTMVAHSHGQTWNGAELARSLGVSEPTVRRHLDALTDALVIRQLPPWHANLKKRQVRSPKVYVRDSGLLHRLLGIGSAVDLGGHPKSGASWEGWVIEQLTVALDPVDVSFWATHAGAELDLRLDLGDRVIGVQIKRTSSPTTTKSMHIALDDLELDHLVVVHGGPHQFALTERITAVPAAHLATDPSRLRTVA